MVSDRPVELMFAELARTELARPEMGNSPTYTVGDGQ